MTGSNIVCTVLEFGDWPTGNTATTSEILLEDIKAALSAMNPQEV